MSGREGLMEILRFSIEHPDLTPDEAVQGCVANLLATIKDLRLHVRVTGKHYQALGIEIGVEHIEVDAAERSIPNWRGLFAEMAHAFGPERAACGYANGVAEELGVSALDVLGALAELARASQ